MKKGWIQKSIGFALLILCGLLVRPATFLRPVFDNNGNPVVVDGRIVTHTDHVKTILANWDAWLSLGSGLVVIFSGLRSLRNRK